MTLACEDANSKLVEVVTVADVDAEKHVDDGLMQIWKMKLDQKVQKYSQTLSTRFGQDFEVEVKSRYRCLVDILKSMLN